ncbi:MAG: V-type ATP synthase subunit E [Angelakisella sp.]|nr:V-type ATP synthase subunit E [Angelakisella sp.]
MANIQERFQMIESAVLAEAHAKANELLNQAQSYKTAALKKAEDEVLRELYNKIQDEVSDIRGTSTRSISQQEAQARQNLLLRREEITKSVFYQVKAHLVAYTRTPEYSKFMIELANQLAAAYPLDGSVIMISREDYHFAIEFDRIFGQKCRILADENIKIGGIKLMNQTAGIFVDETLDSRLEDQKPWFYSHSGLTVV